MARDTFTPTAPTIEFFLDGEVVRATKIAGIQDAVQDGFATLERALGDLHGRSDIFETHPLYINSLGRALGSMAEIQITAPRRFQAFVRGGQALHRGLAQSPWSDTVGALAGATAANVAPVIAGCTHDDGIRCLARYNDIYIEDNNLLSNARFVTNLSGWSTSNVTRDVSDRGALLDMNFRFNYLPYSDDFTQWTPLGTVTVRPRTNPPGFTDFPMSELSIPFDSSDPAGLALSGVGAGNSTRYTFSTWVATSGSKTVHLELAASGRTIVSLDGSPEGASTRGQYWSVPVESTTPKRIYVTAEFDSGSISNRVTARIHTSIGDRTTTDPLYLRGAQVEATIETPGVLTETNGDYAYYQNLYSSMTQAITTEPYRAYRARIRAVPHASYPMTLTLDGLAIASLVSGLNTVSFVPSGTTSVLGVTASGTSWSAAESFLEEAIVSLDAPCQAMSCPGYSAYQKDRTYRAVLAARQDPGRQDFQRPYTLPDDLVGTYGANLPGNILGLFDRVRNRVDPIVPTAWSLASWNGTGLIDDPTFLESWTTAGGDTYPTALTPSGTGTISREIDAIGAGGSIPVDRATLEVPVSGNIKALTADVRLLPGQTYDWTYHANAALGYDGLIETYTTLEGVVEVDLGDETWTSAADLTQRLQISGNALPSEDLVTTPVRNGWDFRRTLRAVGDQAIVRLGVGLVGDGSDTPLSLHSFRVEAIDRSAVGLRYRGAYPLGFNLQAPGEHVFDENLIPWSEEPALWIGNNATTPFDTQLRDADDTVRGFRIGPDTHDALDGIGFMEHVATDWYLAPIASGTMTADSANAYAGNTAMKLERTASAGSFAAYKNDIALRPGDTYTIELYLKATTTIANGFRIRFGNNVLNQSIGDDGVTWQSPNNWIDFTPTTSYQRNHFTFTVDPTFDPTDKYYLYLEHWPGNTETIWIDNLRIYPQAFAETTVPISTIRNDWLTLQFQHRTDTPDTSYASPRIRATQGASTLLDTNLGVQSTWTQEVLTISGIDLTSASGLDLRFSAPDPGGTWNLAAVDVHHGSGLISYLMTTQAPIRTYGYQVDLDAPAVVDAAWSPAYGLVLGDPIRSYLVIAPSGTLDLDPVYDATAFPERGVARVDGHYVAYRGKLGNELTQLEPGWGGTDFHLDTLASGARVEFVPLPQTVANIQGRRLTFADPLPVPSDPVNTRVVVGLYGARLEHPSRMHLVATSTALTRATGDLLTGFLAHVADHRRHFRRDQICSAIVDPSPIANLANMEVQLTASASRVEEIDEALALIVTAFGFPSATSKTVTVAWGDGQTTTQSGTGKVFEGFSHTYDLGPRNRPIPYTIQVEIADLDLRIEKTATLNILVDPTTKGMQSSRAVISILTGALQTSRAYVDAEVSVTQTSRGYVS